MNDIELRLVLSNLMERIAVDASTGKHHIPGVLTKSEIRALAEILKRVGGVPEAVETQPSMHAPTREENAPVEPTAPPFDPGPTMLTMPALDVKIPEELD